MSVDNNCTLTGRLTRDPEVRSGANGKEFVTFSIAVNRPYKDQNGQRPADFINCIGSMDRIVNFLRNYCHKGNLVTVTGELETRTYTNKEGQNVKDYHIRVNDVTNRTPKSENNAGNYDNNGGPAAPSMPPTPNANNNSFAGMGTAVPYEEEVPF